MAPMPPSEPISEEASSGISTILLLFGRADAGQRLGVFLRDEIVERLDVALGNRLGDDLRGAGFGFGGALARLGVAEGGFLAAFGLQDLRLLEAFGLEDLGTLVAFGHHLPAHRFDEVGRRIDVLDLDAGDLDAPGMRGFIDDAQQPLVDGVAIGQQLVEVHRAHHRADVGHGQIEERVLQPRQPGRRPAAR